MNAPASPVPAVTHSALAALGDARAAIERVTTVDDAKGIRDRAEALRVYAAQAGNVFIEYECFRQGEWRRSGIATTAAEVWAIVVAGEVMIAAPSRMVRHVARYSRPHERRECMRGSHPTRGVVIPMGEFLQRLAQVPTVEAAA